MTNPINIRVATPNDAAAVLSVYAPYVENTSVTFELAVPSIEDIRGRIERTLERYPYLVAENEEGEILAFTYAAAFRPRAAYIHSVETSIYVQMDFKGRGLGRRMYEALDALLEKQNIYSVNACIAHIDPPDEYVPNTSRLFHEKLGFTKAAHFDKSGRKFDRWYDMIWMQKILVEHPENPDDFIPFPELDPITIDAILEKA